METYTLYNGEVELVFDPVNHKYKANGKDVLGVTTVLKVINKPALMPWAAKMTAEHIAQNLRPGIPLDEMEIEQLCQAAKGAYRKKAQDSADLGHYAHDWFDNYFRGNNPVTPINKDLRNMTEAFLTFAKQHDIRPISTERKLFSVSRQVAGTTDLECLFEGELTLGDYKTGKSGIYPEHFIQMGGYDICYTEEELSDSERLARRLEGDGEPLVKRHLIINCNKDGELYVAQTRNVQRNRDAFDAALNLQRSLHEIEAETKGSITQVRKAA